MGQKASAFRNSLPIHTLNDPLIVAMTTRQVALVCGETGSGKSTQIPQMVLEHQMATGCGGACSILCTQPRRIAAISLARRVASERGEPCGERGGLVGYQVSLLEAQLLEAQGQGGKL